MSDYDPRDFLNELPLVDVEAMEGELRRHNRRSVLPEELLYVCMRKRAHKLELRISAADTGRSRSYPVRLADASMDGARAVSEHRFSAETEIFIEGRDEADSSELFRVRFRIMNHRIEEIGGADDASATFIHGSMLERSLVSEKPVVYHYGLAHQPADEITEMNFVYKAFLDTLYLNYRFETAKKKGGKK